MAIADLIVSAANRPVAWARSGSAGGIALALTLALAAPAFGTTAEAGQARIKQVRPVAEQGLRTRSAQSGARSQANPSSSVPISSISDDTVIFNCDVDDWLWILREKGYSDVKLQEGSERKGNANKIIEATIKGIDTIVQLYGCDNDGDCDGYSITLHFGKQDGFSTAMIHRFNDESMSKMFLMSDGELAMQGADSFGTGVTKLYLLASVEYLGTQIDVALGLKP